MNRMFDNILVQYFYYFLLSYIFFYDISFAFFLIKRIVISVRLLSFFNIIYIIIKMNL